MPLKFSCPEARIYLVESGQVLTLDEIANGLAEVTQSVKATNEDYFVLIGDLSALKSLPLDLPSVRRVLAANHTPTAILLVRPPHIASMIASILDKMSDWNFEELPTREAALQRAHQVLAEKAETIRQK